MTLDIVTTDGHGAADVALARTVRDALEKYAPIRIWGHNIQIDAHAGTVTLLGIARSHTVKEIAERLVRGVKGVSAVQNKLVVDFDIEIDVAQALASDPRTRAGFPGILVGVVFGITYLKGIVASAEIKSAATEITRRVPGVRLVSNELITLPTLKDTSKPEATEKSSAAVGPTA